MQYFATIGRALHVAQHFEKTCKCLVNILDLKQGVITGSVFLDDAGLSTFCDKIQKRMLGTAIRDFEELASIPPDLQCILRTANSSRNNIAHDSTFPAIDPFAPEEALLESLESLSEDVENLCDAAAAVCSIIHSVTEHEILHLSKHYTSDVMLWVFSDFKDEDFMSKWRKEEKEG